MKKLNLFIVGAVAALLLASNWAILRGISRAVEPITAMRQEVGTQVASLLHPTPTVIPDPITIVHEIRALARLEAMQYSVEKVIAAETGQGPFGFLFGDRLLLVAHGSVIAGVDLDKLGVEDVVVDSEGRVTLALPRAEIFITALDSEKSYVYDREIGLLRKGDVELESAARLAAEKAMSEAARQDGILDQAQVNAENYLYRLLRSLGFSDVRFTVAAEPAR